MALPRYKLELLRYPRLDNFSATDPAEVVALVGFLEDRHVRLLPIDKRAPLRKPGEGWGAAFASYLAEAGCPLVGERAPYAPAQLVDYLRWLVNHAVSLDYEEGAKAINAAAAEAVAEAAAQGRGAGAGAGAGAGGGRAVAAVSASAQALIAQLAELLHVNVDGRDALQALQTIHRAVRQRVVPALAAQERAHKAAEADASADAAASASSSGAAGSGSSGAAAGAGVRGRGGGGHRPGPVPPTSQLVDLKTFPLGFSTGAEAADKAAAVLRMLYITDLRELQDAVNDILVTVQEWTAKPKTDASLGHVGR